MRVIQDSDDDSGSEIEDNGSKDAPTVPQERVKDASSGATGSTESLKRAFAKAHHDHLQSPSGQDTSPFAKEPQSSVSLPEHPSKRRKISEKPDGAIAPSLDNSARPVTQVTEDYPPTEPFHHQIINQNVSHVAGVTNFMDLSGTTRQEYAQHEPMALFPEPSSTVANATQTQQRLFAGLSGPGLLGSEFDSVAPQLQHHPQPSVPWSEILNLSPAGAGDRSDFNQRSEEVSENCVQNSERTQDTSVSQPVQRCSSGRPGDSPLRHEVVSKHFSLEECTQLPHAAGPSQNVQHTAPHTTQAEQSTPCSSKVPPRKEADIYEILSSDDELIGDLPKEKYNPRPSRSISLKVSSNQPVDYSIRPEKAVKGSKRRKPTTSAAATRSASANGSLSTPEKVKQICEMGFTPTSTGKALKQNHGDVTQTIEWLISNGLGEDELARPNTSRRESASKVAVTDQSHIAESPALKLPAAEDTIAASTSHAPAAVSQPESNRREPQKAIHQYLNEAMISNGDHSKSPKVQVVIPSMSPHKKLIQTETDPQEPTASKKPMRRKTTTDLQDLDAGCGSSAAVEPKVVKKKRGRPKKVATASLPSESAREERIETNIPPKVPTEGDDTSISVQQTVEAAAEQVPTLVDSEDGKIEDAPKCPALPRKEPGVQRLPTTSYTPEEATKTPSRSPTSKGRVTYRVGLSRRARIAPLLRTVKK